MAVSFRFLSGFLDIPTPSLQSTRKGGNLSLRPRDLAPIYQSQTRDAKGSKRWGSTQGLIATAVPGIPVLY